MIKNKNASHRGAEVVVTTRMCPMGDQSGYKNKNASRGTKVVVNDQSGCYE